MKALQLLQPRSFDFVDIPVPVMDIDNTERILVQTRWASLCGSDISFFNGNKRYITYPLAAGVPNHENVGQVVESQSKEFRPGDLVLAIPEGDRGLAEYYVAQPCKAIHLPDSLANCDESCFIQPLSTVVHAVDQLGEIQGKSIAVIGLGSIGLFFCWLLRQREAGYILGIDPNNNRCLLAEKLGASKTISMRSVEAVHASRMEAEQWLPIDICIEAVGHQTETINDCFELVRKQGTVLSFGVPDQPVYPIEYETFFRKNLHLVAVVTPDWSEYLAKACDLFIVNRKELACMATHRLPIQDAAKAFTLYETYDENIIKVILDAASWE